MGEPSTYAVYKSDSGGFYAIKQQNVLMGAATNTQLSSSNQYPGLPRNIRPRKAIYINAGQTRTLVYGNAADYGAAPGEVTIQGVLYKLASKQNERVRVLRP